MRHENVRKRCIPPPPSVHAVSVLPQAFAGDSNKSSALPTSSAYSVINLVSISSFIIYLISFIWRDCQDATSWRRSRFAATRSAAHQLACLEIPCLENRAQFRLAHRTRLALVAVPRFPFNAVHSFRELQFAAIAFRAFLFCLIPWSFVSLAALSCSAGHLWQSHRIDGFRPCGCLRLSQRAAAAAPEVEARRS